MKNYYLIIIFLISLICFQANSQTVKVLFDATKAETAGNADWVIDADLNNLGWNTGPAVLNGGSDSNPQRIPTPPQSGITAATPETYWKGGLSYWGIDCARQNYTVETLPYNGQITFGNGSNAQDLSNYDVFIVCEPNILFTASEKTAILAFVQNGGGLFMIADHNSSDRNNDGEDAPDVWNDLISNNSVQANPFGITFDFTDFSQTSSNVPSLPGDSILHGPFGDVTQIQYSAGTSITINTSANSSAKGVIYKTGSSFGSTNIMFAYARYGNGKVAAIGDSSPCDDGSGDSGDGLFDGYVGDANGNHRKLLMNATIWLATPNSATTPTADFTASPLNICPGQSTTFTNASSSGITSYSWNFGAGATPATANSAGPHTVSYATSGTKTISLTVISGGGSNTTTKSNYINVNQTDDNNACTIDACNTSTGSVTHTAVNVNDNNACTTDACNTSTGVITHTAVTTDDGNACTTDACNTSTGSVTHTSVNIDDGNACTTDACNSSTGSVSHTVINTNDGNACTTDACNTSTGVSHTPVNTDDGNACTTDACNTSTGTVTHTVMNVDDGNACTEDNCNTLTGTISHTAVNVDDNNICTTDACNTSSGAVSHTAVNTDDGNACTADGCNSVTGIFHTQVCNSYNAYLKNINFVDCKNLEFEIWIEWTGTNLQKFQFFQTGIDFNYIGLANGGTLTGAFQPGSADPSLPIVQQAPNFNINQLSKQIRLLAAIATPSSTAASILPPSGLRIGKFRITNTVNFTAGATPDFVWKYLVGTSSTTKTVLSCYLNGATTGTDITQQSQHVVTGNPAFNPDCNNANLNLKLFLDGYYTGNGLMQPLLYFIDPQHFSQNDCDTVKVELHAANSPHALITSDKVVMKSDGTTSISFPSGLSNSSYYISIIHRNCIETWSKNPVLLSAVTNYDFTTSASQAFGDNLKSTFDNLYYAIYSGDINRDGAIDGSDFLDLDPSIQMGDGGYLIGDLNGDGAVDGSDFLVLDPNIQLGIGAFIP
jgi:hypothetical protein